MEYVPAVVPPQHKQSTPHDDWCVPCHVAGAWQLALGRRHRWVSSLGFPYMGGGWVAAGKAWRLPRAVEGLGCPGQAAVRCTTAHASLVEAGYPWSAFHAARRDEGALPQHTALLKRALGTHSCGSTCAGCNGPMGATGRTQRTWPAVRRYHRWSPLHCAEVVYGTRGAGRMAAARRSERGGADGVTASPLICGYKDFMSAGAIRS